MSELQATIEYSVELHKFYNVDLFQRGFYQIRCDLHSCSKLSAKTEVSLPRASSSTESTLPACIVNGVAVSKTFQILYRNEEIVLEDVIHFRVHLVLDSAKIQESLDSADFEIEVGLWFSEDGFGMEQLDSLECVSSRTLKLDFVSCRGLHYSLPVLFDYFHLSAVSMTVHGVLVSIHQPYLPSPRAGNKRNKNRRSGSNLSTMETVLFGSQLNVKYGTLKTRLAIATTIYQEVCLLLLQSLEGLQGSLEHLCHLLPDTQKPSLKLIDVRARLKLLAKATDNLTNEDDFLQRANSDISQLCAENILLWNKYLEKFTLRESVRRHLTEIHHNHRLRRFSEGFFTMRNPRKSVLCCLDAKHQHHLTVSEAVRKSDYFQTLPNLQVHCKDLDGSSSTLPIIFEDTYSDGLPKRFSTCDNITLFPGCLLVPCGETSSLDINSSRNIETIKGETQEDENHQNSSERPQRNLSHQTKDNTDQQGRKKKISLPGKLTRVRNTREMGSAEFAEKYAVPKKYTSDADAQSATEAKFNLRNKFRGTNKQEGRKKSFAERKSSSESIKESGAPASMSGGTVKSSAGFSHLECCSVVPYNLQEEPDEQELPSTVGANDNKHIKICCRSSTGACAARSFSEDKEEESSVSERSGYISNFTDNSVSSPDSNRLNESPARFADRTVYRAEDQCLDPAKKDAVVGSFQSIRQDVLTSFEALGSEGGSFDAGTQKEVGTNDSNTDQCDRKSSKSIESAQRFQDATHNKNCTTKEVEDCQTAASTADNPAAESLDIRMKQSRENHNDADDLKSSKFFGSLPPRRSSCGTPIESKENKVGVGTSRLRKFLRDDSLDSPRLVLEKSLRSRSEEPAVEPADTEIRRPRFRSENWNENNDGEVAEKHEISNKNETRNNEVQHGTENKSAPSSKVLPPEQFRDPSPPKKVASLQEERMQGSSPVSKEHSSSLVEIHQTPAEPVVISFVKPADRAKEMSVFCEEGVVSDSSKISRSNTIAFMSEESEKKDVFRRKSNVTIEKPLTDTRTRKQQSLDNGLSQRLSSSLQFIDRPPQTQSLYISNRETEGVVLEQTSVRNSKIYALESSNLGFTCCDWLPNHMSIQNYKLLKKIECIIGSKPLNFVRARENFKRMTGFPGALYSDFQFRYCTPYFTQTTEHSSSTTSHLVVCVHGLDGNSADLRLVKTYLEIALPSANLDFLMSEINQADTFQSLEDMTDKLVNEINYYIKNFSKKISRISFIGHSLGCILIRSAITRPELIKHSSKFYTFLSLSGPHLGTMYNNSGLVNAGLWMIQKWKKAGSLQQLTLKDSSDIRNTFLYKLSQKSNLQLFKHVLLAGSSQDKYVPIHSARIELCKSAIKDTGVYGTAYREMVNNILQPLVNGESEIVRYDVHHALPNNTNSLIGRAAHIAVLDSELFIEKFLVIAALKYFQ